MKKLLPLLLAFLSFYAYSQTPQEVFSNVNTVSKEFETMYFEANMEILSRGRTLTKEFYGYVDDTTDSSFMEYTNPQDEGTRYLKLTNDMWVYIPDAGDVLKLSGHLLRDSMMGSDISYDDMMDQGSLTEEYSAESLSTVQYEGKDVYLLTIRAIDKNKVSYVKQDFYVNMDDYSIEKMVMFAQGRSEDRAIKEFLLKDYKNVGKLYMPMTMAVVDLRKKNSKTTLTYTKTDIDVAIDKKMFTRAYLEQ